MHNQSLYIKRFKNCMKNRFEKCIIIYRVKLASLFTALSNVYVKFRIVQFSVSVTDGTCNIHFEVPANNVVQYISYD